METLLELVTGGQRCRKDDVVVFVCLWEVCVLESIARGLVSGCLATRVEMLILRLYSNNSVRPSVPWGKKHCTEVIAERKGGGFQGGTFSTPRNFQGQYVMILDDTCNVFKLTVNPADTVAKTNWGFTSCFHQICFLEGQLIQTLAYHGKKVKISS